MKKISRFLILTLLSFCIVLPAFAWRSTTYYLTSSLFCAIIWRRMKINELRRING